MKYLYYILALLVISCSSHRSGDSRQKSHPSHAYTLVDTAQYKLTYFESDYVPVYSDIYYEDGTQRFKLTSTISLRNTSLTDSAFILSAVYYDSFGKELRSYIDSAVMLSPLESVEFVVEEVGNTGGTGANFIIDWAATKYTDQLLIQSIMIGTSFQQGISFVCDAKVISHKTINESMK